MKKIKKSRLLGLLLLSVLLAACSQHNPWAGVSKTEDNEIFISYDRFIAKLDANGKRQWTYPEKDERDATFYAPVVYEADRVYVGDYQGNVYALDRETGAEIWAHKVGGTRLFGLFKFGGSTDRIIGPIAIGENVLFVPDELGVIALNKENGELVNWRLDAERAVWSQPIYVPATDDQPALLYVGSLDHHLYAVDVSNVDPNDTIDLDELESATEADVLWKADLEGAIAGQPTLDVERNLLFAGTFGEKLYAVDASNGAILDEYEANNWIWEAPALYAGNLYMSDIDGYLHALRFVDGQFEQIWSRQVSKGKFRAKPLVTEDLVIIGSDDKTIYAVRREDGSNEWAREVDSQLLSDLVQIMGEDDELLLVTATLDRDEAVMALQLDNGNERWSYKHKD